MRRCALGLVRLVANALVWFTRFVAALLVAWRIFLRR